MSVYIIEFLEKLPWQTATFLCCVGLVALWVLFLRRERRFPTKHIEGVLDKWAGHQEEGHDVRFCAVEGRVSSIEGDMEQVDRRTKEVTVLQNDVHHLAVRVDEIREVQKENTGEMRAIQKGVARIEGWLKRAASNGATK